MSFLVGIASDVVDTFAEAAGLSEEVQSVKDTIEDKTGINPDVILSGDLPSGIANLIQQQDDVIQNKFGDARRIDLSNKIQLTRSDHFNINCPLLNIKTTDNILLNTFYELFFSNNTSDRSYKIRSEICTLLLNFRYVYLSYAGFLVSPSFALENASKAVRALLFTLNGFIEDLIDERPINDIFIMSLRSELITGFVNSFYIYILILLSILSGKKTYIKLFSKIIK